MPASLSPNELGGGLEKKRSNESSTRRKRFGCEVSRAYAPFTLFAKLLNSK
ncbi:hypothetical protein HanPI659440_Chr16g0621971 [Helianthus annuus]|nr:hypothetical protein HanHA300_Chr16g0592411 [Helianthus annuus]KAJ0680232.1 hypothetical protein HanPI659440_Chr16g0621971 [Helianthus annuus]